LILMALAPGTRLGAYEVVAMLGVGGMGEVYRARDTRLDREVAIKALPQRFASDPERLARFEREAKLLASLNQPGIAAIHGLEVVDRTSYLILELVDGESLAQRLTRGALPLDNALAIARQICEALEAAHERGIIHRDLKPANIMLARTGRVKVLDFGLARVADEPSSVDPAIAPTASAVGTQRGVILGTPAYMSPEQAAGQTADARSDIWSVGIVLFQMLTGRPPFGGDSVMRILAAVLTSESDWTTLPARTPLSIRKLLRRLLNKDRNRRLADVRDVSLEIDDALSPLAIDAPPATRRGSATPWWLAAALAAALLTVFVVWAPWRGTKVADRPSMRLNVDLGPDALANQSFDVAISPDGTRLAYPARTADGKILLATRLLSEPTPTLLAGTRGGRRHELNDRHVYLEQPGLQTFVQLVLE
jgi:serine/threonine-protein kinase